MNHCRDDICQSFLKLEVLISTFSQNFVHDNAKYINLKNP